MYNEQRAYKSAILALLGLFLLTVLIFTVYGEKIYAMGKPLVTVSPVRLNGPYDNTAELDLAALRNDENGDYVYIMSAEQAYSRIEYSVRYTPVVVLSKTGTRFETNAGIASYNDFGLPGDGSAVLTETAPLKDGMRVLWNGSGRK
ncbi:MAG: hypothetical protein LBR72_08605 [Oscillospiraceae bacterium]|jgi:hypothetical protein|nr:hypothetical protein [Oscillospiraceae bacterium]